ncbi:hypothetical protein LTR08_004382 [Meristemomyces frigidus]|nr:hypothetical protein LTR08_004382 [Meristemomyces frigidus]
MEYGSPEQDDAFQTPAQKRKSAAGRKLVRWNPDLDQLLLLCVDYECTKQGISIPWDDIAKLIEGHLSGEAVKQHLAKLYKFREEDGHKVPPKLDRNERRKAYATTAIGTPAAARGRGKKATTLGVGAARQVTPVKPGRGLLFKKAEPKSKRTPKKDAGTPKTPVIGSGPKKPVNVIKLENNSDDDFHEEAAQHTKPVARSGKRGRKSKVTDEVDGEELNETPSKKPKNDNYLRERPSVNYAEQMAQEDEDNDSGEEGITLRSDYLKKEQHSSQGTNGGYTAQPPQYGLTTPAHSEPLQRYPSATGTGHNYSDDATPLNPSPTDSHYGMSNFNYTHAPPPMMQTPDNNGFNQGYNGMHPFQHNSNLAAGDADGYAHETLSAVNNFANHQAGSHQTPFGTSTQHYSDTDIYNNGVVHTSQQDDGDTIHVRAIFNGSSDHHSNAAFPDTTEHGVNSFTMHNGGSDVHLNTGFGTASDHSSQHTINNSPTQILNGDTGITPALAQTGFHPQAPAHVDSFDSGFGGMFKPDGDEHYLPADDMFGYLNFDSHNDMAVSAASGLDR